MNRILYTLLFILSCGYAFGQTTTNYQTWYKFNYKVSGDSVYAHTAFYAPVRDTTWTPTQIGAIVYKSTDQKLYVCTALTGQKWTEIGSGGSGSYTAGYGLILAADAFRVDTTLIGSKSFIRGMPAYGITSTHMNLWNTAYSWGNHASASYATQAGLNDTATALRALLSSASIDSFTYATRRYVDSLAVPKSRTITIAGVTHDLSSDAAFEPYHFVYSLEGLMSGDGMYVALVNDLPSPAAYRYYGTDSNGVKGWHPLGTASGGGGASTTLSTLTYGATTTWDYSTQGTAAKVTLTGNTTLSITNLPASVTYLTLEVVQDATGSRTITLPAGTKVIGGGAGAVTLTTTGGATDILTFYYNGTTLFANIGTNYN